MPVYVHRNGQLVDKETGAPMVPPEKAHITPGVPMVMGFSAYACPITGKEIRTLEQHNANLKKHNCIEAAELPKATGGEIRNERFARKHGLKVSDRYKDEPWKPKTRKDLNG